MAAQTELRPSAVRRLREALSEALIGHDTLIERLLIALLVRGHVLVEGAPGLAKTRAVKELAACISADFARIQCTPDLMPGDLTGTTVYRPDTGQFDFVAGPVFHNLILVDEINRAPPKVQSALLEAMAEEQVTIAGETRALPLPFVVVATQNPIEHEGTFPLPEAQLDRFMLKVELALPGIEAERAILDLVETEGQGGALPPRAAVTLEDLAAAQADAGRVHLAPELRDYIVRLVMATREGALAGDIAHAASPRGSIALAAATRAKAYLAGRDYATPDDVADLAPDVLAHRLVLTWRAVSEGRSARALVADLLQQVEPL